MRHTLIVAAAAALATVVGWTVPALLVERELHETRIELLRSRQALARTLDILERHTAPPVRPEGGYREIAGGDASVVGRGLAARVLLITPGGSLVMRSVSAETPRSCATALHDLVVQAAVDPPGSCWSPRRARKPPRADPRRWP